MRRLLAVLSVCLFTWPQLAVAERQSRPMDEKAALTTALLPVPRATLKRDVLPKALIDLSLRPGHHHDWFVVKFAEDLQVRLRAGELVELAGKPLTGLAAARALPGITVVERLFERPEGDLDRDRAFASTRAGFTVADLNNYYVVRLAKEADASAVAARWLALPAVETAYFQAIPEVACADVGVTTPSFVANQDYLEPAPGGVNAFDAWSFNPAGRGVPSFHFCDIEFGWNVNHEDFGDVAILNGASDPDFNHGTAVLGEIVSCDGPFGTSGIANGVTARMVKVGSSAANAFDIAASFLDPGEVYLIELHQQGPDSGLQCQCNCGQFEFVPMEWDQACFDAIQTHTASGIIVVEAGGNGGMNLDGPQYVGRFNRSIRDSGAILVGAGTPTAHSPECWTNSGSRIDCQGYGSSVATTGYGNLFNPGDPNQHYTSSFSGTSSASPIVTGCAIVVQNLSQQMFGVTLDAITMRAILQFYGTPQGPPTTRLIGVLPDLKQIIDAAYRVAMTHTPLGDTQDQSNPYPVVATATPGFLPESVLGVTIHYSVSGGAYQSVAMTPTGNPNEWQGAIPAQPAGSYVRYYLAADATNGPDTFFPAGGATAPILFIVGTMVPVASDDLEAPTSWIAGAAGDDATSGFWVRGDPFGTSLGGSIIVAPEDDHTPNPGTQAFITGNPGPGALPSAGDVDGGRTTLRSPVFDLSSQTYLRISAWVWSRFPGDDTLKVEVSNNAGQTWTRLASITSDLPQWQFVKYELLRENVPFTNGMQLRFVASDYGGESLVEAGVDDLVIEGLQQGTTGVSPASPAAPVALALSAAPNPFSGRTQITTQVPAGTRTAAIRIYDAGGRLVRTLPANPQSSWDGRNAGGREVAPGRYWIRLEAPNGETSLPIVKLP